MANGMNYDKQLIIVMLTHPMNNLREFGRNLFNKHPDKSELVEYNVESKVPSVIESRVSGALTESSRIQIVGHGDMNGLTCAGANGKKMAKFIAEKAAPNLKRIKRISLTVCYGAGNPDRFKAINPYSSFAAELHSYLRTDYEVISEITARAATMIVKNQGQKETRIAYRGYGEPYRHKADDVKYVYSWVQDDQVIVNKAEQMDVD